MRNLQFKDVGKVSKILKKLQLRVDKDLNVQDEEALGASLFLKLAENYSAIQEDLAEFMADLLKDEDITKAKFLELELDEVYDYFMKLKEDKGLTRFLSIVSKTMKTTTE
ncbi:hypothetical protein [Helcococcus kunzii]|uniref:hypothetical protein n=1 Tax=Helcococcus kunzii TaxID=40091 RepID=UPI001BAF9C99|nr:hypothetical protein [Helcococcus kunzii]QUY64294.1 hypothetical protein GUI37_01675 [Helcococcus kunzii]